MRFGVMVLIWVMFWSQLVQETGNVIDALKAWLTPPPVEVLSEWDADAMERGIICDDGIGFAFDTGNPDWAPKCWKEI